MANEILQSIADDIKKMDAQIAEAEELMRVMIEVGEDVQSVSAQLKSLKIKKQKWQDMLAKRGIKAV